MAIIQDINKDKMVQITSKNNRQYLSLRNDYGEVLPFQAIIIGTSGHGKGLAVEHFVEKWRQETHGVTIIISDPKDEAEFSFVMYEPIKKYHTDRLMMDGTPKRTHKCILYHPFTFNIPKGYLPDINFFTLPIKSMTRGEWSILTESSATSESIKLMMRTAENLSKYDGLFKFLHDIERAVRGKKSGKKPSPDPKLFNLSVGGGTSKSITEVAGLLYPFRKNYFLRKDSCPYKLDWEKILTDNENYHVFLSMWLGDEKLKNFMVLCLLNQILDNRQYLKRPLLMIMPELLRQCPRNPLPNTYKYFLVEAMSNALVTVRGMGRGMSIIGDTQNWYETNDKIKGSFGVTMFGQLNSKDQEVVCKANGYVRDIREKLQNMNPNSYFLYGFEKDDPFRIFLPGHRHKEPEYNWIETYSKHFRDRMKRYDELVRYMKKEFDAEDKEIKDMIKKRLDEEKREEERKEREAEKKKAQEEKPKKEDKNKKVIMKGIYEMRKDESLSENDKSWRKIGMKFNMSHLTAKKYYDAYEKELEENSPNDWEDLIAVGGGDDKS